MDHHGADCGVPGVDVVPADGVRSLVEGQLEVERKRDCLLVFLKYPRAGEVKTRLGAVISLERAAALYEEWIGQVLEKVQPVRERTRVVGYFDGGPQEAFEAWDLLVDEWQPQGGGDLGEKLTNGFRLGHQRGGSVVAIGTDCLEIRADLIREAFVALRHADAVFGPARDGGYYLVGSGKYRPEFFDGIRWSSEKTLTEHLERCRELGMSVSLLPTLSDIDTWEDWRDYCQRAAIPVEEVPT